MKKLLHWAMRATESESRRNVWRLAACQAMQLSTNATLIAINGLAGFALAPSEVLATLPVTLWVIGGMLVTLPASFYMKALGRQRGFVHGAVAGVAGALVSALAVWVQDFWLLCLGALLFGGQNAIAQYYRFAAADSAHEDFKASAISLVLAGGIVGGVVGPATSRYSIDLLPQRFMGAYLALIVFAVIAIALLRIGRIPEPAEDVRTEGGRPMTRIAANPRFVVAVTAGAVGYGVMYFLMTSAPIAMDRCGYPYGDAAFVVSWHVMAMFAPSFFTGALIRRAGVLRVILAGALLNVFAVGVALSSVDISAFWFSLLLNGIGWNFLYVGGTALLTEIYRPEERAKVQGVNDFLIFATMAASSFFSGLLIAAAGWTAVNLAALPMLGVLVAVTIWLAFRERRAVAVSMA